MKLKLKIESLIWNLKLKLEVEIRNWNLKFKLVIEFWNWNLKMKLDKVHNQLIKYVCFKFVNIAQLACLKNFWIEKFSVSLDSQYMDIGSRLVPNIFPSFLTYTDNFCFVYIVVLPWNFIGCGLCVFFILNNTQYPIQPPSDS